MGDGTRAPTRGAPTGGGRVDGRVLGMRTWAPTRGAPTGGPGGWPRSGDKDLGTHKGCPYGGWPGGWPRSGDEDLGTHKGCPYGGGRVDGCGLGMRTWAPTRGAPTGGGRVHGCVLGMWTWAPTRGAPTGVSEGLARSVLFVQPVLEAAQEGGGNCAGVEEADGCDPEVGLAGGGEPVAFCRPVGGGDAEQPLPGLGNEPGGDRDEEEDTEPFHDGKTLDLVLGEGGEDQGHHGAEGRGGDGKGEKLFDRKDKNVYEGNDEEDPHDGDEGGGQGSVEGIGADRHGRHHEGGEGVLIFFVEEEGADEEAYELGDDEQAEKADDEEVVSAEIEADIVHQTGLHPGQKPAQDAAKNEGIDHQKLQHGIAAEVQEIAASQCEERPHPYLLGLSSKYTSTNLINSRIYEPT